MQSPYGKPDAFRPLPNTNPVSLSERTGCCWPIEHGSTHLFCNASVNPRSRNRWCDGHYRMGNSLTYKAGRDG